MLHYLFDSHSIQPAKIFVYDVDRHLVPLLGAGAPPRARQGAAQMMGALVQQLGTALVPYLLLVVVPLMGRMSDPDSAVRQAATATFAPVVALLPLAQVSDSDDDNYSSWH